MLIFYVNWFLVGLRKRWNYWISIY
jgi:hypothetical protein